MNAVLSRPPALDPLVDAAFLADPYPAYRALREGGPIHWSEEFFGGAWLLTRHADVEAVLRDARFSAQRTGGWVNDAAAERGELAGFQKLFARALLFLDAPDHGRLRALLQPAFRPEALARLKPVIGRIVDELIDGLEDADEFDLIAGLARPLPVRVISQILGIEGADRAAIRDEAELLAQCAMLLFAGHETTRNLLGNGLRALLSHPDQWQRLRQAPELIPSAVRELLRYDSPVQYTGRRVTTDLALHGQRLRRGVLVLTLIGAANRDPARHDRPEQLDVTRADPGALSFSSGVHVCLGAALTRLEAEVVFGRLLARWPDLRLASVRPQWCANPAYRGLAALLLRRAAATFA